MERTAILIDGAYFLKRYRHTYGKGHSPEQVAKNLFAMCIKHLNETDNLYRIFFYDCPPFSKKVHNPISKECIDFSKTAIFKFRTELHEELVKLRKVALRLGRISDSGGGWSIRPRMMKELLLGKITAEEVTEDDVVYSMNQKGVDIKMGLDIASIAYKKLASRIVLVTGDSDFVPAAKFARREGIDVILDPMWQPINKDLYTHIDGLKSHCPRR